MKEQTIGVAVIGNGVRARRVVQQLLDDSGRRVRVVAVYDPDRECSRAQLSHWNQPDASICASCEEAIRTPGVDWVMVFSPNACHREAIVGGFRAGRHVFSEKPLATTIADCQAIYEAQQKSGRLFATGFVLRYAPIYRRVRELLDSGRFGRLLSLEANEDIRPEHGAYIMCNWRRHSALAGPHVLEKCCHDLDLILWFTGTLPSRVASFGGRSFFIRENAGLLEKYGRAAFFTPAWPDPHSTGRPFSGDTDLMDHSAVAAVFRNQVTLTFTAGMSSAMPERRIRFNCSEGTMAVELYSRTIRCCRLGSDEIRVISFAGDGHGGGDDYIMKELYDSMCTGATPRCSGIEGLRSAVFALAIDEAARTGRIVDLEPVWRSLGQ